MLHQSRVLLVRASLLAMAAASSSACLSSGDDPSSLSPTSSERDASGVPLDEDPSSADADASVGSTAQLDAAGPEGVPSQRDAGQPANDGSAPDGPGGSRGNGGNGQTPDGAGGNTASGGAGGATSPVVSPSSGGTPNGPSGAGGAAGTTNPAGCEPNSLRCDGDTPQICDAERVWRALLSCDAPAVCVAGECRVPLASECPLIPSLPKFTSSTHVVDGDGAEFSDIAPVTYDLIDAPIVSASYAAALPTRVTLRLAWSEQAFVAHVHVEDPAIHTYQGSTLEYFWQGDNVQFFIAPTDALTGMYSGTEDGGATHLVIVPPSDARASQAIEIYEPCYACVDAKPSTIAHAARAVPGGYEIELSWPWASPAGAFTSGDRVALNLVVGAQDEAGAGLQLEGLLANNPVDGETPCGGATHPGCDDRTWCFSTLE